MIHPVSRVSLSLLILLTWQSVGAVESADSAIPKVESPIEINGDINKPCWKEIPVVRADYIKSKAAVLSDEPHLSVKYAWDEHYLYIAYEAFDTNLVAASKPGTKGPASNLRPICENWKKDEKVDIVEFFISFGDEHFLWELHHNALNQFNDIWCTVPDPAWPIAKSSLARFGIIFNAEEFIHDDGEFTVAMAVKMKPKADGKPSTVNDPSDTDTGYTAELRLPWRGLGAPVTAAPPEKKDVKDSAWKMAGESISILAVMQDGDLKERYYHSSPQEIPSWFHKAQKQWPVYKFSEPATEK